MVKRYANKAGVDKIISPHTLRRILGHSDISTTTIYITLANIDVETE